MIAFAGNPLDRASDKRSDSAWLAAARAQPGTKVLPLWKLQPLVLGPETSAQTSELGFVDASLANGLGADAEVFLGLDSDVAHFARDISALTDGWGGLYRLGLRDARSAAALLPLNQWHDMGQAKVHRLAQPLSLCAQCGAPTAHRTAAIAVCKPQGRTFSAHRPAVIMLGRRGIAVFWDAIRNLPAGSIRRWPASSNLAKP
jgi:NAD+ diphosphatase